MNRGQFKFALGVAIALALFVLAIPICCHQLCPKPFPFLTVTGYTICFTQSASLYIKRQCTTKSFQMEEPLITKIVYIPAYWRWCFGNFIPETNQSYQL